MKRFFKKSLICILIIMMMSNFIMSMPLSYAYINESEIVEELIIVQGEKKEFKSGGIGDSIAGFFSGFIGLLTWPIRALVIALASGLNGILTALVQIGGGSTIEGISGATGADAFFVTPFHVFFNKIPLLNVNFFELDIDNTTVKLFRQSVAGWYYTMRLISSMVLLVILVYIGIRMALSTVDPASKAQYKKMLVDWVCSLVLLFLLHYIMLFTFECNNALVKAMESLADELNMTEFMQDLSIKALDPLDPILSSVSIVVYCMIIFQTLSFIIAYMKRMITIGFLIIIAPLITITYSIDRIGDGKAQALNTWLKEFVYNILIQPFHCVLFLSFSKVALDLLTSSDANYSNIATAVLAVLCIQYIKEGENLVKKIFGFHNADSLSTLATGAAVSAALLSKGGKAGMAVGKTAAKGVRAVSKTASKSLNFAKNTKLGKKATAIASKATANVKSVASSGLNTIKESAVGQGIMRHMKARKESQIDKQMEKDLGKEGFEKLRDGADTPEGKAKYEAARAEAGKKVNDKTMLNKGKKITGVATKAGRYVANSAAGKYVQANSGKIAGAMVGAVLGAAGLANGAAGMVSGYMIGSGMVEGYLANSSGTVKKELNGLCQANSNFGDEGTTEEQMLMVKAIGDSEGYKDIGKKLDELKNQLSKLGMSNNQTQIAWGNIHRQLTLDPGSVNRDTVRSALEKTDDFGNLSAEQQEQAVELMSDHTQFMAQASLYKNMSNLENAGFGISEMSEIVGEKTPNYGNNGAPVNTSTYNENSDDGPTDNPPTNNNPVTLNTEEIQEFTEKFVEDLTRETSNSVNEINERIQQLNALLNKFKNVDDNTKTELLNAINQSNNLGNNNFNNSADIEAYLNTKILNLTEEKENFNNN